MKKGIVIGVILGFILSIGTNALAATSIFKDSGWWSAAANWAAKNNIVHGHSDGTFGGNEPVTRGQLVTILQNMANQGYLNMPSDQTSAATATSQPATAQSQPAATQTQPAGAQSQPATTQSPSPAPASSATSADIGTTKTINGLSITVNSVEPYSGAISSVTPLQKDHAVEVDVTVENTSSHSTLVDSSEFNLFDAQNYQLDQVLPDDINANPIGDTVPPGKKLQGKLWFDVPKQSGTWELQYTPMLSLNNNYISWKFPAK